MSRRRVSRDAGRGACPGGVRPLRREMRAGGALWPRPWPGSDPLLPHAATRRCTLPRRVTNDAGRRTASSSTAWRRSRTRRPAARAARRNPPVTCRSSSSGVCSVELCSDLLLVSVVEGAPARAFSFAVVRVLRISFLAPLHRSRPAHPSAATDRSPCRPTTRRRRAGRGPAPVSDRSAREQDCATGEPTARGRRYVAGHDHAGREPGRRPLAVLENA